ncbi:MAG TPA: galactokinase family protein [Thermoleophilaceae bacterium]
MQVRAHGPGRVNLIGEHTDYNGGLALPFAVAPGVTVTAEGSAGDHFEVQAHDLDERDTFAVPERVSGWRAFPRGVVAELREAGHALPFARLAIDSDLPQGSGLSSSAALSTALCLALLGVGGEEAGDRIELARLCSRVENEWVGAHTGLLDQLAALASQEGHALLIDFDRLKLTHVPLDLRGFTLATLDSGGSHDNAASGYNERRDECALACELLGIPSLSQAGAADAGRLPEPLGRRVLHVLSENQRVREAVAALGRGDLEEVGRLLDGSHESLRDCYEVSTPEVERAVEAMKDAGAAGARVMGAGFGGSVLGLFPPGVDPPAAAEPVEPGPAARLL